MKGLGIRDETTSGAGKNEKNRKGKERVQERASEREGNDGNPANGMIHPLIHSFIHSCSPAGGSFECQSQMSRTFGIARVREWVGE